MTSLTFTQLIQPIFQLGESPLYDEREGALLFCDIPAGAIHSVDLSTRLVTTFTVPPPVGSLGLAESGRLIVALRDRVGLLDRSTGDFRMIAEIGNGPETRLNDGGRAGGAFCGQHGRGREPPARPLFRVTADGRVEEKVVGARFPMACLSPDGNDLIRRHHRRVD
jgi:sugar lactone lactonase YvrE